MVRSSRGAEARLPSAVQTASLISGVTATFSAPSSAAMRQSEAAVTFATVGSRYSPRKLIAVESTPERSFSLLLSNSRAAEATTGWT